MINAISLDMLQSAGVGALALVVGMILTHRVKWLQKFCIPSPVSGGIIFSLITLVLYSFFDIEVSFDGTLKEAFMLLFSLLWDFSLICVYCVRAVAHWL